MLLHGLIGFASIMGASALSYVYHFVSVRLLSNEIYGSLSVIIGFYTIFVTPTLSIQRVVARDIAKLSHEKKEEEIRFVFRKNLRLVSFAGLIIGLLFFLLAYFISNLYQDSELLLPLKILALLIPFWYVSSVVKGYIQAKERIILLGIVVILEQVSKMVLGVSFMLLGYGLLGAAAPVGSGALLVIPLVFYFYCRELSGSSTPHDSHFNRSVTKIFLTDVVLMAFIFLDLFFVKYFLGSVEAGFYNVAALTTKVLMYSMFGVMYAFLPRASKLDLRKDWVKVKSLIVKSVVILIPLFLVLSIFTTPIVKVSYTEKYLDAVPALRILLVGMLFYSIFNIPLNLFWSQNEEDFPLKLSVVILAFDGILLYFLVPAYGLIGAAYSTTISSLVLLVSSFLKVNEMRKF